MEGNVTVHPDLDNNMLQLYFGINGKLFPCNDLAPSALTTCFPPVCRTGHSRRSGNDTGGVGVRNTFRMLPPTYEGTTCLNVEAGFTNVLVHFKLGDPSWFGGPQQVVSVEAPVDPFYGWVFVKQ